MSATEDLLLLIRGDASGAKAALNEVSSGLTDTGDHTQKLGGFLEELGGKFGMSTEHMSGFLGSLGEIEVIGAGAVVAVAGIVAEVVHLTEASAKVGEELYDLSLKSNISVERLSTLKFAVEAVGGNVDQFANSVFMMQRRMADSPDDFEKGLHRIGLSLTDLEGLKPDEQFLRISKAMAQAGPDANLAAASMELFSRQGRDLLPIMLKLGEQGDGLIQTARDLGFEWSEKDAKAAEELETQSRILHMEWEKIWIDIGKFFLPALARLETDLGGVIHLLFGSQTPAKGSLADRISMPGQIEANKGKLSGWSSGLNLSGLDIPPEMSSPDSLVIGNPDAEKALAHWEEEQRKKREKAARDQVKAAEQLQEAYDHAGEVVDDWIRKTREQNDAAIEHAGNTIDMFMRKQREQDEAAFEHADRVVTDFMRKQREDLEAAGESADRVITDWQRKNTRAFGEYLRSDLPKTILSAVEGGGHIGQTIGAGILGNVFQENGALTKTLSSGLTHVLGSTVGGALGSVIPGLGTLLGSGLGSLIDHVFTGSEESRMVNKPRDQFFAAMGGLDTLNNEILKQTGSLDLVQRVFDAKTANEYKAAVEGVTRAVDGYRSTLTQAAADEQTVAGRLSSIYDVTPELQAALDQAFNAKTPADYEAALKGISGVLDDQDAKQKHLDDTLKKYGLDWTELGDQAKTAKVAETSAGIVEEWKLMRGAGVDVNHEMEGMKGTLNDFVKDAKKAGVEVPSSMKEVLQTAIDAGVLYDDNGKKITDMKDLGLKFGDTMETVMRDKVTPAIEHLADVLEHKLGPAITNIPDGNFTVHGHVDLPPNFPNGDVDTSGLEGHARGGVFIREHLARIAEGGMPEIVGDVPFMTRALSGALAKLNRFDPGRVATPFGGSPVQVNLTVEGNVLTERDLMAVIDRHLTDTFMQLGGGLPVNH